MPFQLPPASPPPPKRTLGHYFARSLWGTLWQQSARHRYWMKGAAVAHGAACALLLGSSAIMGAASLWPAVNQFMQSYLPLLGTDWATTWQNAIAQITSEWTIKHRWWLFLVSGVATLGIWLKDVGLTQQIIRSDADLASHLIPTLRQRATTVAVAFATAVLTLLATGFVLMALPQSLQEPGNTSVWHLLHVTFVQGLRWSLAISTIALAYGLLYRSSQKSSARPMPVLPGTVLATILWLLTAIVLKRHLSTLSSHHWLYSVGSVITLGLLGFYVCTLGLLLGGQYNKLVNQYVPRARSRPTATQVSPPSFDSFTIQKPPYR